MTAFNELTVSALLWSSGVETVGVMNFSLQYEGNSPAAAAVSTLSLAVVLGLALLVTGSGAICRAARFRGGCDDLVGSRWD
ncbi:MULTISPECIES: hypothetical protein [unclassified Aurantimonas]|nr:MULTISPECIES: hypothetical protein [unclassified Aurantimonas]MEC5292892.1 hypothetical protein [Aurantimonas sp. C2-3-R2]